MEPCAPGTEDDPPIMYSTLTKKENEQQRALNLKAFLRNGKYVNVFELSYANGVEQWFCNVCECPVMGRVFQHEMGRRHKQNTVNNHNKASDEDKMPEDSEEREIVEVAPGEPLPPGFEETDRVAQIQERLDGFKVGPLVALEYVLELQDAEPTKEPFYLCLLCDKKGDPRTVLTHLSSYNHISQYLQKHFPTTWRLLVPYNTKQYKRNWQTALQKVAEGVEKKFGRLKPFPIEKDKFDKDRMHYLEIVAKGMHFSERSGYTFEELVVHDELIKTHENEDRSERSYESSITNNWGASSFIEKPFKKRSPSPPVVDKPSKRNRKKQEPAFTVQNDGNAQNQAGKQLSGVKPGGQPAAGSAPRRRSLSSVSSASDLSDNGKREPKQKNDRGRPPFQRNRSPINRDKNFSYASRRSPRRKSPIKRNSISPRRGSPPFRRRSISPRRGSPSFRRRSPYRRRSPSPKHNKRRSPSTDMNEKEKEKLRKVEEFRKLSRAIENDMIKTLKQHEKNPEKHPQYNEEWKKFWNARYKELKAIGVDVSKYDFKPEWIQFWNKRMVELHSDEVRSRKEALRKRLGLSLELNPIKFKIGFGPGNTLIDNKSGKPLPMAAQPDQDDEVIIIEDKDDDPIEKRGQRGDPSQRLKKRSPSPKQRSLDKRSRGRSRSAEYRGKGYKRSRSSSGNRSRSRNRSHSRNRSRSRNRSLTKRKSPSRRRSLSKDRNSRSRNSPTRRRSKSRERSWERKRLVRESSFERDLKGKERIRTVADLPWDVRPAYIDPYHAPLGPRNPVDLRPPSPEEHDDNTEVNVVVVLRILTALEDRLGSLGPKVIDLLAQALAFEKNEANSSEQLLDNDINCVLFETVKEKLKGQMIAGLVDHIQQRAFKKAIKKIAALMHLASQRKKQRDKLLPKISGPTPSGAVDKAAIAKQIANALVAQGKTDVTQDELEQLINAVVAMAEASKVTTKPVTTASFLQMAGSSNASDLKIKASEQVSLDQLTEPLTPSPGKNSTSNMENLSDSDLQTLLQNFKDLSTEEQHNLINYLKKLEFQEPERVEKLRKFVSVDPGSKDKDTTEKYDDEEENEFKQSSKNGGGVDDDKLVTVLSDEENNDDKTETDKHDKKVNVDSDEEEYSFDDVVKSVKDKEIEHTKKVLEDTMKYDKTKPNLNSAKDLISDLMSNITKKNASTSKSVDLLGLGKPSNSNPTMTNVDLSKILNINVASLASIVNNVKNMASNEAGKVIPLASPKRNQPKLNFDLSLKPDNSKSGLGVEHPLGAFSVGPNRFGPGTSDGSDRFLMNMDRPGPIQNRFGQIGADVGNSTRMGLGDPERMVPWGAERMGPVVPERVAPGGLERMGPVGMNRVGPGGPERMGLGGSERFGSGSQERFIPMGPDRFGSGGQDRFGPGGPERFGPGGPDRFGTSGGPTRLGNEGPRVGPNRFDGDPDRFELRDRLPAPNADRFGPGGASRIPDRLGPAGPDRFGPGGPNITEGNLEGFVGPDRGFGHPDRGILGSDRGPRPLVPRLNAPNVQRPNIDNFNRGTGRPFPRGLQRLPAPDFNRQHGNFNNRW